MQPRTFLKIGDLVKINVAYSEVAMFLGIAGTVCSFEIINCSRDADRIHPAAQWIRPDGSPISYPLKVGEVGIYDNIEGMYAYDVEVLNEND